MMMMSSDDSFIKLVPDKSERQKRQKALVVAARYRTKLKPDQFKAALRRRGFSLRPAYRIKVYEEYASDEGLKRAMNKWLMSGKTLNKFIRESFDYSIQQGENLIVQIHGNIRSGKSRAARALVRVVMQMANVNPRYHMDPDNPAEARPFLLNQGATRFSNIYASYTFSTSKRDVAIMEANDWLIQDEMPASRGEGSRNILKDIENLLKIASGKRRLNFMFLNPFPIILETVDFYIRILARDNQKKRTLGVVSFLTLGKAPKLKYAGVIVIDVNEPDELTAWYEEMNDRVKHKYQESAGVNLLDMSMSQVDQILAAVEKSGERFTIIQALRPWVELTLPHIAENPRVDSIVALAYNKLKCKEQDRKRKDKTERGQANNFQVDAQGRFTFDRIAWLRDNFVKTGQVEERDFNVYTAWKDGRTAEEIIKMQALRIGRPRVSQIVKEITKLEGVASKVMGDEYELFLADQLRNKEKDAIVIHDGGESKPDIITRYPDGKERVISAKISDKLDRRIYYTPDECKPEIHYARAKRDMGIECECVINVWDLPTFTMHQQRINLDEELPKQFAFDLPKITEPEETDDEPDENLNGD